MLRDTRLLVFIQKKKERKEKCDKVYYIVHLINYQTLLSVFHPICGYLKVGLKKLASAFFFINPLLGVNMSEYLIHCISGKLSDNVHPTILMYRPIRLTQCCCTQVKSPGVKILCVLYLHYNVEFWAHLNDMEIPETKRFFSQNV